MAGVALLGPSHGDSPECRLISWNIRSLHFTPPKPGPQPEIRTKKRVVIEMIVIVCYSSCVYIYITVNSCVCLFCKDIVIDHHCPLIILIKLLFLVGLALGGS